MLFIGIDPADAGSQDFYSTIAHEFQHMINFSRIYMQDGREQDLWINEGLYAGAEYVYSSEIDGQRRDWYNKDPLDTIQRGNNFFVWNGTWEGENIDTVMDNYATVYLFFQWLRLHADNGIGIYGDILNIESGYYGYGNQIDVEMTSEGGLTEISRRKLEGRRESVWPEARRKIEGSRRKIAGRADEAP